MKKIAVINDLSGFGKCSLSVALPIISCHKIQCCPLTTGVFSNQTGYDSFKSVDFTDYMQGFIDEWALLSPKFDAILTGFISNSRQGKIISDFIERFATCTTKLVVDPIMGDDGKRYPGFDDDIIDVVTSLAKKADIITPNLTELSILCGLDYDKLITLSENDLLSEIKKACDILGVTVITTGISLSDDVIANAVYENGEVRFIKTNKIGKSFSGTGDILASFVACGAVKGESVFDCVKRATLFISKSIEKTICDTNGEYNPADGVHFECFLDSIL